MLRVVVKIDESGFTVLERALFNPDLAVGPLLGLPGFLRRATTHRILSLFFYLVHLHVVDTTFLDLQTVLSLDYLRQ